MLARSAKKAKALHLALIVCGGSDPDATGNLQSTIGNSSHPL